MRGWRGCSSRASPPDLSALSPGERNSFVRQRQLGQPRAAPLLVDVDSGRREARVGEGARGDGDHARPPLDLVEDLYAAGRAEMVACPEALVGLAAPGRMAPLHLDRAGLVGGVPGEGAAGAALAVEAMAD